MRVLQGYCSAATVRVARILSAATVRVPQFVLHRELRVASKVVLGFERRAPNQHVMPLHRIKWTKCMDLDGF